MNKPGGESEASPVEEALAALLRKSDPDGEKIGRCFRESFDWAYNGQNTGFYKIEQLSKTEKAHIGSIVEVQLRRTLDGVITDGDVMDFKIAGQEIDCKYSMRAGGWMIPMEAVGHYALLCHADDAASTWEMGIIRVTDDVLNAGGNRDRKRTISRAGREKIVWVWKDQPMPPNTLLQLPQSTVDVIMARKTGQQRINLLFEYAQGIVVPRGIVATVAMQKDYMKRIRGNGGARTYLAPKGIVLLGSYKKHQKVARDLGLPVPKDGDTISARVYPWSEGDTSPRSLIGDSCWRRATDADPIVSAPLALYS